MAEIQPFRGIRYHTPTSGPLERVICPPYDVISPEEQEALYRQDPCNFVRIILNCSEPGDDELSPYRRAAEFLNRWLEAGVLREDAEPAIYEYRQEFTNPADDRRYTRIGIFCALRLEPYSAGVVLPHEETRTKAKEDRLRLMRATRSNPEPIYCMFEDSRRFVARVLEAAPRDGEEQRAEIDGDVHVLSVISDSNAIRAIQDFLKDARIWIADGHHRYETALSYRNECPQSEIQNPKSTVHYILVVLSAFNDPGMVVLPTHRLVKNISESRLEQLKLQLERYFDVIEVDRESLAERMKVDSEKGEHRFGVITRDSDWAIDLRDVSVMNAAVEGHVDVWKRLDVSILQALVLDRSLGIPAPQMATTPDVGYTRDWDEAIEKVDSGEYQLALMLNNPSAGEVQRVASAGDKMPPKSTFFYPKLWSGLVMRRL
jgi:uncharacterized protein (DUF1015 family)